ncbi:hypothetical protein Droror1_Dr00019673, partial [Drosera rotundifolia]
MSKVSPLGPIPAKHRERRPQPLGGHPSPLDTRDARHRGRRTHIFVDHSLAGHAPRRPQLLPVGHRERRTQETLGSSFTSGSVLIAGQA